MVKLGSVDVLGGGPAGLYVATLIRKADPATRVRVIEQNPADATFGFGVVFSDQALDFLKTDDPETCALVTPHMERWRNMTLDLEGARVVIDGIGFAAIGRLTLLMLLAERARAAGVDLLHNHALADPGTLEADLIIAADGANSLIRNSEPTAFDVTMEHFSNRFCWFGTPRPFDTLTQTFVRTDKGALNAHHYRYQADMSTFIVECDAASFQAHGFAGMDETETARACADIFRDTLDGAPLVANRSIWRQFPRLWCDNWVSGNRVVIGDAAHTAHFSVGSGTRLAMEDAIALARALGDHDDLDAALAAFQAARKPIAKKIVDAANTSALWYEDFADKMQLAPLDFGFDYITRSGRIDMARLRQMSPEFMADYEVHRMRTAS